MASDDVRSKVQATVAKWKMQLTEENIDDFTEFITEHFEKIRTLPTLNQMKPEVKYPRKPGYRPPAEENPYNAWYYKTDIHGASTGKLAGKRVAVKDTVSVADVPMMNGSRLMEGYVPEVDATIVTRILDAGGIIAGKAVCENLCFSGNSFTSATGPVLNVNDVTRSSGGSSSGSATLVRCGDVDMSIGGDQGGSIRIPSSWSGTVGIKATHGLVPYTGTVGIVFSLDNVGPIARNVKDCALLLEVIAGPDGMDARQNRSVVIPEYSKQLKSDISGMRIGLVKEGFATCEKEVVDVVKEAASKMQKAGAIVEEVSIADFENGTPAFLALGFLGMYEEVFDMAFTAPHTLSHQDTRLYKFIKANIQERCRELAHSNNLYCMMGEAMEPEERHEMMSHAQNVALKLRADYDEVLKSYDVIMMPTLPMPAPKLPTKVERVKDQLHQLFMMTSNTPQFNLTGHPALTMTAGHVGDLPIGMMLAGRYHDEQTIFNVAHAFELIREAK